MAGNYQTLRRKRQQAEEKMAQLQQQLAALRVEEEQRLGQLATRAGLLEFELSDEVLLEAFSELARRFRGETDGTKRKAQADGAGAAGTAVGTSAAAPGGPDHAAAASG